MKTRKEDKVINAEKEINEFARDIFGININEHQSVILLKYNNGKYEMTYAYGDPVKECRNAKFSIENNQIMVKYDVCELDTR